jgi:Uma2 family endonuclease
MSTETLGYLEIASNLPPAGVVTFHDVSWEEYEQLIEELGEARGLRVSYNDGTLEIMTVSSEHESYAAFINLLIGHLSFRLRTNIRFFGSATMRTKKKRKAANRMRAFMFSRPRPSVTGFKSTSPSILRPTSLSK